MKPRKARAYRPLEKSVQKAIIEFLKLRRAFVIRTNSGATKVGDRYVKFNSAPGCSDLLVCYRGRWLALECKRDAKGEPTPDQEVFLENVQRAGGISAVVFDVHQVQAILDGIDEELSGFHLNQH